jgi:hypothetical protein
MWRAGVQELRTPCSDCAMTSFLSPGWTSSPISSRRLPQLHWPSSATTAPLRCRLAADFRWRCRKATWVMSRCQQCLLLGGDMPGTCRPGLHHRTQLEDWQIHRDHQTTNEHAKSHDDQRFHQRAKRRDSLVDFFLEDSNLKRTRDPDAFAGNGWRDSVRLGAILMG